MLCVLIKARRVGLFSFFFFFNDTATTEIYTLSLHDALPIFGQVFFDPGPGKDIREFSKGGHTAVIEWWPRTISTAEERSEEHTSELQSRLHLVCRLLLEKKKSRQPPHTSPLNQPRALTASVQ